MDKGACLNDYCDGVVECFGWRKRVPNKLGPQSVCLYYSIGFGNFIPMSVKATFVNFP